MAMRGKALPKSYPSRCKHLRFHIPLPALQPSTAANRGERGYGVYSAGDPVPVRLKRLVKTMLKTEGKLKPPTAPHAVASVDDGVTLNEYAYDANGNMVMRSEFGVIWTQEFNAENRLASISDGTDTWSFTYDGGGNRIKQENPDGTVTLFLGGGIYTLEDAAGNPVVTKYYSIAGQKVAMEGTDGLQYLLADHLGSIIAVTDTSGALVEDSEQRYLPFGVPRLAATGSTTDFSYTGQRALVAVGLMDYNARWYDAALQKFVSPDTIIPSDGSSQALNRYSYVNSNPIRFTDPTGRMPVAGCGDEGKNMCAPTAAEIIQNNFNEAYFNAQTAQAKCKAGNSNYCSGWENAVNDVVKTVDKVKKVLDEASDVGKPGYDQYDLEIDYCKSFISMNGPYSSPTNCFLTQHLRFDPSKVYWTKAGVDFAGAIVPEAKISKQDIDAISLILDFSSGTLTIDEASREGWAEEHTIDLVLIILARTTAYGQYINLASGLNEVGKGFYFDLSGY
jgi:RHS repeat-associated protein